MIARVRKALDENQKGFTLVELLVVVIIIGILAAIAIPLYLNQQNNAHNSAVKADLHNAATAVAAALVEDPTETEVTLPPWSNSVVGTPQNTAEIENGGFEISAVSAGGPTFTIDETGVITEDD